jgi:hypothetical protein
MYARIKDKEGTTLLHRNMPNDFDTVKECKAQTFRIDWKAARTQKEGGTGKSISSAQWNDAPCLLPNPFYPVLVKYLVRAENRKFLLLTLANQKSVKGISMMKW